MFKVLIYSFKI